MRLILVILIFFSGTVLSRYYEKRRFDRSIYDRFESPTANKDLEKKQWIFTDYETHFRAHKDKEENVCYLEKLEDNVATEEFLKNRIQWRKHISKTFYASNEALTKLEAWRIAGGRIVDFCQGRQIILLQNSIPIPKQAEDPFLNILPRDENDIATRRIADVVLTPLINRAKRQVALEERQKLNENFTRSRSRRQTQQSQGKFRGQTQSQYLNIGNDDQKEGKAEAEATQQSSRSVVSGSRGMGQAQSMSFGSSGCEDCPKYIDDVQYVQFPSTTNVGTHYAGTTLPRVGSEIAGTLTSGTFPTIKTSRENLVRPGIITASPSTGTTYSGDLTPGTLIKDGGKPYSGSVTYPGRILESTTTGGGVIYPGRVPGTTITGDGVTYPKNVPDVRVTGTGAIYPEAVPGTTTSGGDIIYFNGVPHPTAIRDSVLYSDVTITGSQVPHFGRIPTIPTAGREMPYSGNIHSPKITTTGITYPEGTSGTTLNGNGVVYPGRVPDTTTTNGGVTYPSSVRDTTTISGGVAYPSSVPAAAPITGVAYPGSVASTASGDGVSYPGRTADTTSTVYPGSVSGVTTPGGAVTYPGSVPGVTTPGGAVTYPGNIPGVITPGGTVAYPGSVPSTASGSVSYPGRVPGTTTIGGSAVYPSSIPGITTHGGTVSYPGRVPGITTIGGSEVYPGSVPGVITHGGAVAYPESVPSTTRIGGSEVYPGSVPGVITHGGAVAYPESVPSTTRIGSSAAYPSGVPGTVGSSGIIYPESTQGVMTTGKLGTYPSNIITDTKETTHGQILTESKATAGTTTYPSGQISGTKLSGEGIYPIPEEGSIRADRVIYPSVHTSGILPSNTAGRTTIVGYPGGVSSPPGQLKETIHYPGKIAPGSQASSTIPLESGTYSEGAMPTTTGHFITNDHTNYPGSISTQTSAGNLYTDTLPETSRSHISPGIITTGLTSDAGTMMSYPKSTGVQAGSDNVHFQKGGTDQSRTLYSSDTAKYPEGGMIQIPEAGKYENNRAIIPSGYPQQGQYPNIVKWDNSGRPVEQRPSEGQGIRQQYTGSQYPSNIGPTTSTGETSQYYQQPSSFPSIEDDNSNSQASSSIKQIDSGTQASASAQGKFGQGTAQSQVTGTYSGSGSFSAQAGSTDINKSAQTEINAGKEGATSNAQGMGGYGKSQAQVQLDSESGATSTGAQSSGWNHGTNSQVQASSKGGMADAQANGEGSTSSQAQIGFHPYLKTDEKIERHSKPFRGGGTASAQSGTHRGQSQSQLEGSFQYGITYTGAAQAGSGSGAAASRKQFNFNFTNTELFKPFKPAYIPQIVQSNNSELTNTSSNINYEYNQDKFQQGLQTSSSSQKAVITKPTNENSQNVANKPNQSTEKSQIDDTTYDYEEEYDGEDYDTSPIQTSMDTKISKTYTTEQNNSNHQLQRIHVTTGNQYDIKVKQDTNTAQVGDMLQPGQSLSGYAIPPGFRGRVTSIAGDETVAHGDGNSQSQTISLVPMEPNITHENKSPISEIRSLKTNHERLAESHILSKEKRKNNFSQIQNQQISKEYSKPITNIPIKPSYYTVTNSIAGKMDGSRNSPRKYEHRYYTKSSTCGYFTFSCNIVYGSNGRTKICKPKMPTYPDGTPMKC